MIITSSRVTACVVSGDEKDKRRQMLLRKSAMNASVLDDLRGILCNRACTLSKSGYPTVVYVCGHMLHFDWNTFLLVECKSFSFQRSILRPHLSYRSVVMQLYCVVSMLVNRTVLRDYVNER